LSVANAVRRQLSAFYTWALPRLPDGINNPVQSAAKVTALAKRDRVLSDAELARLWQVLEGEREPWRSALRLLVLTGQRREEVLGADWSEFDVKGGVWTIPAARTKNKMTHIVPLNPAAISLLAGLEGAPGRLFPKGTGLAGRAAARIREAMGSETPHWRWHDIRRTVATGLQRIGVRLEVTEAILNHKSGSQSGIVAVYQLHDWADEKRVALDLWGQEVERLVT
jgi:integrase